MINAHQAFEISNRMGYGTSDYIFDDITRAAYQGSHGVMLQEALPTQQIEYFKALGYSVAYGPLAWQTTIMWDKPV